MLKSIFCLLLIWFFCCGRCLSQENSYGDFCIAIDPSYWPASGFRGDVEGRLQGNHWLVGSIFYYQGIINKFGRANIEPAKRVVFADGDSMRGLGFELQHKMFFEGSDFYFAYGPVFKRYTVSFREAMWHKKVMDGLEYYVHEPVSLQQRINRFGATAIIGKRQHFNDFFIVDFHIGAAYKQSVVTADAEGYRSYTRNEWDLAFSGFYPIGGFKLGYLF